MQECTIWARILHPVLKPAEQFGCHEFGQHVWSRDTQVIINVTFGDVCTDTSNLDAGHVTLDLNKGKASPHTTDVWRLFITTSFSLCGRQRALLSNSVRSWLCAWNAWQHRRLCIEGVCGTRSCHSPEQWVHALDVGFRLINDEL